MTKEIIKIENQEKIEGLQINLLHQRILKLKLQGMATFLELAVCLKTVKDRELYKKMGYETFEAYIGTPELGFDRGTVYRLIEIYEKFCKEFNVAPGRLMRIYWTKLREILPVVDKNNYEKWLNKAESLSRSDLMLEVRESRKTETPELPEGKYQIIYADPPWSYQDQGCQGTMADHYKGMKLEDICALPVKDISAENSILFLWATYPMLKEALQVIEAWGFEYKTIAFQWVKLNKGGKGHFYGLGRWTRGNTEPCLLATKGKPQRVSKSVFQLIEAPLTKHSRKPDIVRDKIIELVGDLSRIELFARKENKMFDNSKGWELWGDQSGNNDKL